MSDGQLPLPPADPQAMQQMLTQMPAPAGVPQSAMAPAPAPPPGAEQQQMTPMAGSGPGGTVPSQPSQGSQQNQIPSKMSAAPLLARVLSAAFGKQTQDQRGYGPATGGGPGDIGAQPGRPVSRLDQFEGFLGEFLDSFSKGMANAGTGPAANGRGFGAAVQAPYQQAMQQYQAGQAQQEQQAQIGLQRAETERTQAQTQKVPVQPYGPSGPTIYMSAQEAKGIYQSQATAQGKLAVAGVDRFKPSPFGIFDQQTGQLVNGTGPGGIGAMATVTPQMAKQYGIPQQYVGKQIKNSDLIGFMNANDKGKTVVQGSEGPSLVDKNTAGQGGGAGITNLGLGSPANNSIAQTKVQIANAKDLLKVQGNQNQVDLALGRLQEIRAHSDVLANLIDTGKISLAMGGDGIIRGTIGRNVQLTPEQQKFASDFQTMSEDINLLRLPQGGGGFRSEEAFEAMQAQRGRLAQNLGVFNGVLDNTIESFKGIKSANQQALDTYNSVANNGKKKATGGGGGGGNSKVDSLAQKYGAPKS